MTVSKKVAALLSANPISPRGAARKKTATKKRTIGAPSQRARKTASGYTKKPSARLMARRSADTIPGYYPNPIKEGGAGAVREWLSLEAGKALRDIKSGKISSAKTTSAADCMANYLAGFLMGAHIGGAISERDRMDTLRDLSKAIRMASK